jgi:hypothetical protein
MKALLILALALAIPVGAQTTSQQRIPVRKQQRPIRVDTVVMQRVDTVTILRSDTVYVMTPPPASLAAFDTTLKSDSTCGRGWVPIPIPIPIPVAHHPSEPDSPSTPTPPASVAPEPSTIWMVGAALTVLGIARRRHKRDE